MDDVRFDHLTRGLTGGLGRRQSRRGVLAALTALGALGGAVWGEQTGAAAKPKRKKKKKQCKGGKKRCGKRCFDLRTDARHCGTCATACAASELCQGGACVEKQCGTGADCLVFVTAQQFPASGLEGIDGADARCTRLADEAQRVGTFKAWLSDDLSSPATSFTRNPGRYVLPTGDVVAADWAALTSGTLAHAIDRDQDGQYRPETIKTNTLPDGTAASTTETCDRWSKNSGTSGAGGSATDTNGRWTNAWPGNCSGFESLYCFQQSGPGFVLEPQ